MTDPPWITTEATVTTCRYQSPGLSILAFGFQTGEKFRITFDYYAHGQLYSGEFQSPTAIPENQHIPITYNPLHPEQNSLIHSINSSQPTNRTPLIAIGIAGSVILSLVWLAILRGCR
ncbi:MAG: DUF3592 domain-containing protein [Edaphobacter sp.]